MEEISARKRLKIIQLYLDSKSVREIASQVGVAVGTVANVIADAKNGRMLQIQEPWEQIQLTRELKADLKTSHVTLEQAVLGATLAERLLEQRIDPSDVGPCLAFWHRMASENEGPDAVRIALRLDAACQRTGLSPEALIEKVEFLEKEVARLEPVKAKLAEKEKELQALEKRRAPLAAEIAGAEKKRDRWRQDVERLEGREAELSSRVAALEKRRDDAEEGLAVANSGKKLLAEIGLPPDELPGFAQRMAAVAQRHGMTTALLRERLLRELEQLDNGMGLDSQTNAKRAELRQINKSIDAKRIEHEGLTSEVDELQKQRASIKSQMAADMALLNRELHSHIAAVKAAGGELQEALSSTASKVSAGTQKVVDQAFEVGQETGRYQETIQENKPVSTLVNLFRGTGEVRPQEAQVVALAVLRGLKDWVRRDPQLATVRFSLTRALESAISELERWAH